MQRGCLQCLKDSSFLVCVGAQTACVQYARVVRTMPRFYLAPSQWQRASTVSMKRTTLARHTRGATPHARVAKRWDEIRR